MPQHVWGVNKMHLLFYVYNNKIWQLCSVPFIELDSCNGRPKFQKLLPICFQYELLHSQYNSQLNEFKTSWAHMFLLNTPRVACKYDFPLGFPNLFFSLSLSVDINSKCMTNVFATPIVFITLYTHNRQSCKLLTPCTVIVLNYFILLVKFTFSVFYPIANQHSILNLATTLSYLLSS